MYASTKHYLTHDLAVNQGQESPFIHLLSAGVAGIATATLTNPIWLVKTRMQLQVEAVVVAAHHKQAAADIRLTAGHSPAAANAHAAATTATVPYYRNSFDCFRQVVRQEGVRGLFRGLTASYLGIGESTIQWVAYEQLKKWARHYRTEQHRRAYSGGGGGGGGGGNDDDDGDAEDYNDNGDSSDIAYPSMIAPPRLMDYFLTAAVAKFFASVLTYPHEVLRTRLRQAKTIVDTSATATTTTTTTATTATPKGTSPSASRTVPRYHGMWDVVRVVAKEEGVMAFYGGLTAHLLRTVPNAAIMFFCYGRWWW